MVVGLHRIVESHVLVVEDIQPVVVGRRKVVRVEPVLLGVDIVGMFVVGTERLVVDAVVLVPGMLAASMVGETVEVHKVAAMKQAEQHMDWARKQSVH